MDVVVLESPFSGDIARNVAYAQRAMFDARSRKEIVIAPHLLWTQHHQAPGHFVSDYDAKYDVPHGDRDVSLQQIHTLRTMAKRVVFYMDYGMSSGMKDGMEQCVKENLPYETRVLGDCHLDEENKKARAALVTTDPSPLIPPATPLEEKTPTDSNPPPPPRKKPKKVRCAAMTDFDGCCKSTCMYMATQNHFCDKHQAFNPDTTTFTYYSFLGGPFTSTATELGWQAPDTA